MDSIENEEGFSTNRFICKGFVDTFLEPPYDLDLKSELFSYGEYFDGFCKVIFSDLHQLEIYKWSIDCSNIFDSGKEWWGSYYWTVYNPIQKTYIAILATSSD